MFYRIGEAAVGYRVHLVSRRATLRRRRSAEMGKDGRAVYEGEKGKQEDRLRVWMAMGRGCWNSCSFRQMHTCRILLRMTCSQSQTGLHYGASTMGMSMSDCGKVR